MRKKLTTKILTDLKFSQSVNFWCSWQY